VSRQLVAPAGMEELDALDWFTFICSSCGQETFVGREPTQAVEDFACMVEWLYGDPPVCTDCLRGDG